MAAKKKCGTVAIIGQPNVGKSTLLNHFVGTKLSITSRKAQTTRYQLLGIHTTDETQFIFVDTPGYQTKHLNMMNRGLNQSVVNALKEVDVVLHLTTPSFIDEIDEKIMQMIPKETPAILAMNKIDLIKDKNKQAYYSLQENRKFDFNHLKALKAKKYVEKITV